MGNKTEENNEEQLAKPKEQKTTKAKENLAKPTEKNSKNNGTPSKTSGKIKENLAKPGEKT